MAKRFSFSLQKLLDYREQVFDIELGILGDMNVKLNALRDELENMNNIMKRGSDELREKYAVGITPLEISQHKIYLDSIGDDIRQQKAKIQLQLKAIDRQTDKVREAKIEISTMEKLKEKKLEEYNYLENKAQELFIEEFVSNQKATMNAAV